MMTRDHGSYLSVTGCTREQIADAVRAHTLPNPKYTQLAKQLRSAKRYGNKRKMFQLAKGLEHTPKEVSYAQVIDGELVLPVATNWPHEKLARYRDPEEINYDLLGTLRLYQCAVVADATRARHAVISAPTGSGKTIMGCAAIYERKAKTIVLVPTEPIQQQWVKKCQEWLSVDADRIGGKKPMRNDAPIAIAINNSAISDANSIMHYDHVIVDECHRVAAKGLYGLLSTLPAKFRLGLSATPWRRDGLTDVIFWTLGRQIAIPRGPLVACGALLALDFRQVATQFATDLDAGECFADVIAELTEDTNRNRLIEQLAQDATGVCIVLCGTTDHCDRLAAMIAGSAVLHGKQSAGARRAADTAIADGARIIIATSDLLGEGFDLPVAQTLILAAPMRFDGRVIQRVGRVVRPSPGQDRGVILDLCDWKVQQLADQAFARRKVYDRIETEQGTTHCQYG